MENNIVKKVTIKEGDGVFNTCNCCNASTSELASPVGKKVDKVYKITLGENANGASITFTACEECLIQLVGEITVTLYHENRK